MPKLHVGHPITDLDTWSQAVNSLRTGRPLRGRSDKAIITFLFTDIEGSTRRWESDAVAMRASLRAHDQALRGAIDANGGEVFACTGDGICAVFGSPTDAVEAAISAQRTLELPVRMGVGTGEAERRGGNYFGTALNRTARLMAAGHGGQILLDGATAALLSEVDVLPLGSRRLRDIACRVDVFQVRAPGLATAFPALRTCDSAAAQLMARCTRLIGRTAELAEIETAVRTHSLVTLTGPGGVGKTRLASEVIHRMACEFPSGISVIELATLTDPAALPSAVAAALDITPRAGRPLADAIADTLKDQQRLLVFDNCEHVLDGAADLIEQILVAASGVRILATSREGLRLPGERLCPVRPLDVDASTALLADHAKALDIALGVEQMAAAAEICCRVDGLPLAIELAASRLTSMTVTELRDRLSDGLRVLAGPRRLPERHRTLRNTVRWSYDLLEDDEQSLLAHCSLFIDRFDLADACAVTGSTDELTTLDLLDALVRKSLLVVDRSGERAQFSMLNTIRRFAEEQSDVRCKCAQTADAARVAQQAYTVAKVSALAMAS